jgi:hypothetical protein
MSHIGGRLNREEMVVDTKNWMLDSVQISIGQFSMPVYNGTVHDFVSAIQPNAATITLLRKPVEISKMMPDGSVVHVRSYVYTFSDDLVPSSIMDQREYMSMEAARLREEEDYLRLMEMGYLDHRPLPNIPYPYKVKQEEKHDDIEDLFIL